jgi:FtsP/CotA-like multicopper oxidase with cupredoxin domain
MNERRTDRRFSRRGLLKLGGQGALLVAAGALIPSAVVRLGSRFGASDARAARGAPGILNAASSGPAAVTQMRLVATDGFTSLPGRDPLYVFGFRDVSAQFNDTPEALDVYKGNVQAPAPIIYVNELDDVTVRLTNIGLVGRPDLDDSHTIHWHGFRNQVTIFDGVPEVSIAVPPGRNFDYFFRPRDEGTYMYHCHFEDTEHVQMGMVGVIFVRPAQDGNTTLYPSGKYAYDDGDGSTGFDREFALLVQDVWTIPHDNLIAVQESIWSDYHADFWVINGRAYPDTIKPNNDPSVPSQPISSLIQVNEGDRALLRWVNLGYEQHAMQLAGITMKIVGQDATFLGPLPSGRADITHLTNTIYIGPGESRDVLFTAPPHSGGAGPDVYLLKNRNLNKLVNGGAPGLGGMLTEVRVYPSGTLPSQTVPNETYPV